MIQGKKILGVIPARGGSKGVPRKNIREVGGKPLIAWTIEEAKKSKYIDRLILSSEDEEIIHVATQWGCDVPFVRPVELARDDTPGVEPVLHALRQLPGYDYVVLLQPTSPLRSAQDIDGCLERLVVTGCHSVVSVTIADKSPYWMYKLNEDCRLRPVIDEGTCYGRRQDLPQVFALNGAVYAAESEWLVVNETFVDTDTVGYPMSKERSLDVDTELDLRVLECLQSKRVSG